MPVLNIADNLHIHTTHAVGQKFSALGKSGSGKTNTLLVFAEQWVTVGGWPLTFIDPMAQAKALPTSLPVILAGRRRKAHVEITEANAAALARLSLRERMSVVIDLSLYQDAEAMEILTRYLGALWAMILPEEEPLPYGILIDEAHLYVPQSGTTPIADLIIDLAKRGRHKNVTTFVATQRAAAIDKEFLTQANLMFAHRMSMGVDMKVIGERLPTANKTLLATMRKLKKGEAVVTGDPEFIGDDEDYIQSQVHLSAALQSVRLPGETGPETVSVKPIDEGILEALAQLANLKTPDNADDTDDVEALHRRIAELHGQVQVLEQALDEVRGERDALDSEVEYLRSRQAEAIPAVANGVAHVAAVRQTPLWEAPAPLFDRTPIPELEESLYRSPRATERAIKKQERAFASLMSYVGSLQKQYRMWLDYLLDHEEMSFSPRELARFTGYSESTIVRFMPDLVHRELVQREKVRGKAVFHVAVRSLFERDYPDLDADDLVQRLKTSLN